ncbi:hypothetical protein Bbelb_322410 [Branchiostoma belcheri]|nr:hypothetical protein Bbelb_322410 [Branchiostoma belcheri]
MELLMSGISHGPRLAPPPPALPPMELLMSGISHGFGGVSQPPPTLMLSPGQGQGGGTFMRSTTASNKMTHKTKVTKGDETVENVAEASETLATMEAGHIPAPPPLPTPEQLRRFSLAQAVPQPNMALQMAGPSALVVPQSPPTSMRSPGQGQGGGTFMRSTTASNKMTHKTKVTKGDETLENVAETSETLATMEAGHIPAPPPLPTREQLRRASLAQAVIHPRVHGVGFGRVPSPPALPPMELLMSGISHEPGLVPSPPPLPPMELLISEISFESRRVPNPPALPPMELLMSGISGFPGQEVSQALPGPLLDLVGAGARQPVPDPNRQYTVMTMYSTQGSNLPQKKARHDEGDGHGTTTEVGVGAKTTKFRTNIPDPPPLPEMKFFVPKPYVQLKGTFGHEIAQKVDRLTQRRKMSIELHIARRDSNDLLLAIEENASKFSPEEVEEMRKEANEDIAKIDACLNELLMSTSLRNLVEDSGSVVEDSGSMCSEELPPVELVSTDDPQTDPLAIQSDSQLTIHLHRQSNESQSTEQHQLKLCQHADHGESAWHQRDNHYQVVHGEKTPENVDTRTTDGTSPPESTAAKADKQSVKGSAEPAAQTQKGTVKGGKREKTKQEYSQKVWEALVGDDNEWESPKTKATPPKDAKKPSTASEDAGAKSTQKGAKAPQAGQTGDQTAKLTPTKIPQPIKDTAVKRKDPIMGTTALSAKRTEVRSTDKTSVTQAAHPPTKIPQPIKETDAQQRKVPLMGTTALLAKRADVQSTDKASVTQAAHPPTKIPQPIKETDAQRNVPVMGTTALSAKRADVQSTDKASVTQAAHPPTKIPQPIKETDAQQRKVPVMGTTALLAKRTEMQSADKASVTQAAHPPTKIPQPIKETDVQRKVPVMGTTALLAKRTEMQSTDKTSVKQAAHPPTKIPQPIKGTVAQQRKVPVMGTTALSAKRTEMQSTDKTSVTQAAHPPTKIPQPIKETDAQRKVPVMGTTALLAKRTEMQTEDKQAAHPPTKIPQPIQVTAVRRKTPMMGTSAPSARRADMQTAGKQTAHPPTKIPQPIPIQVTAVKRETPVVGTTALSARRTEEPKGVQTRPASMKTTQPAKDSPIGQTLP